jgi:hypothetical protein
MRISRFVLPLMAAALMLGACGDSTSSSGNGRLTIMLTDAPGDLKEAWVKFDKIILLRSGSDTTATDSTKRITFTPVTTDYINLLTLTGGKLMELVGAASVPEGTYSELRVVITDAKVTLNDGRTFTTSAGTLKCPSCASSGFKVKFTGGGLTIEGNSTVVLDFDAAASFGHEAGNSGKWVMHPVLRATATTIRFAKITGNATLATGVTIPTCGAQPNKLSAFRPTATLGTDVLTAVTDTLGAYKIANVLPGTYTMGYVKDVTFTNGDSLTFTATPSVATVTVAQGDSAKANYSITAATCH